MNLQEKAEEILETLWIRTQEEKAKAIPLEELGEEQKDAIKQLLSAGYISISNDRVAFENKGLSQGESVIRRHRLAERLLSDVLAPGATLLDERACKFEHMLDRGLEESICNLLGHPRICPHGKPIPFGKCCREGWGQPQKVVSPLSQMTAGGAGKVAYVFAPEAAKLQKLMSMGILPGAPIGLVQRFPSYVFRVRQTEFAVDKEIADAIYVRLGEEPHDEQKEKPRKASFWRRLRLGRRRGASQG